MLIRKKTKYLFKTTTITFLLFLNINILCAQEWYKEVKHRKIELELTAVATDPRPFIAPAIGYGTNKHAFYIAPIFPVVNSYGIMPRYRFYPNGRLNRANFYFSYNLLYVMTEKKSSYYYNIDNYHFIQNSIGYGFDLRMFGEFYLKSEIGLGIQGRWDDSNSDRWYYGLLADIGLKKRFRKK